MDHGFWLVNISNPKSKLSLHGAGSSDKRQSQKHGFAYVDSKLVFGWLKYDRLC